MEPSSKRLIPLIFIITAFSAGCRSQTTQVPVSAPGISIEISSDVCPYIEANAGQQVTWTNTDSQEHVVRHEPEEGDVQFDSGELQPGDSFTFVFVEAGTYPYECSESGGVPGAVTVQP